MDNFLLFKQIFCLLLFFETLSIWPRFGLYFGPPVFPNSFFTTKGRIHLFQLLLLTTLTLLFFDLYPLLASFILVLCTRYLYVIEGKNRLSTYGAVGNVTFLSAAYLFLMQASLQLDSTGQLYRFFYTLLAIEIGIILFAAGIIKWSSGYFKDRGFEYALVNPSWGKWFFLFNRLKPSSWFFKMNNILAALLEVTAGILFFIPQTRSIGAILTIIIFTYVFFTVRVNILSLLMMTLSLLYLPKLSFHFSNLSSPAFLFTLPQSAIFLIKALFICYLVIYIVAILLHLYQIIRKVRIQTFIDKPLNFFCSWRPYFEWDVFTPQLIDYFITIEKVSKKTKEITEVFYDGFSKSYNEFFSNQELFLRFVHHHESSLALNVFHAVRLQLLHNHEIEKKFIERLLRYAETFLTEAESQESIVVFTVNHIRKVNDAFVYQPLGRFFVDVVSKKISYN